MFIRNTGLGPPWDKYYVDYTHLHTDGISISTIGHFMVSGNILQICENAVVTHSVCPTIILFMLYYKIVRVLLVKMIMMIIGVKQSVQNLHGTNMHM